MFPERRECKKGLTKVLARDKKFMGSAELNEIALMVLYRSRSF